MSPSADQWACDTSVAVASLDPNHEAHQVCRRALVERRPALAGHAAFETYSVLTRLPIPLRLSPRRAAQVLASAFPHVCWLDLRETRRLYSELAEVGLAGGAVYDAIVGKAAHIANRTLLTRDRGAVRTYRSLGVNYELIE
jgi:predicted nucleic acid-binding protein